MSSSNAANLSHTAESLRRMALAAAREAGALVKKAFRQGIDAEHKSNPHDLGTDFYLSR